MSLPDYDLEKTFLNQASKIITHPNPAALSLSIRASALVFNDPKSQNLLSLVKKIAKSDATALIIGETGTGKELIARHIHDLSDRKHGPFQAINCGAFSETLVESELFGYEKGAFTGANTSKVGWFETANGGTLFLDEIGDLPESTQVKLLRVLQEREVTKIGSRKPNPIDVRLIAATNVNLEEAVKAGRFREDLYYRIKVVPIDLLPLRERKGDILPLAEHFVAVYKNKLNSPFNPTILPETVNALHDYAWPGNIRELENVIHRALLISNTGQITPKDLNLPSISNTEGMMSVKTSNTSYHREQQIGNSGSVNDEQSNSFYKLQNALDEFIDHSPENLYETVNGLIIKRAFEYSKFNQVHTAKLLGISRNILRARLKELNLIN